jgi:MoxR-like ATPase
MENDDPIIEIFHGLSSFYLGVKDIIDEDLQDNQNEVIKRACEKYIMHCNTSTWLADEKYKFNFAQWVSDHIDFNSHTDEEILSLARESQEQNYFEDSNAKGINFILTEKRFKDEFITLDDIAYLRELINQPYEEDEPDVKHDMTYPKIAAWASCFNPSAYKPYAASELAIGLKYLFNLPKSFPKKGFKALQFSQSCLHQLEAFLRTQDEVSNMFKEFLNHSELTELNWAWIAQDFSLFVTRVLANEEEDQNELQLDDRNPKEQDQIMVPYTIADATKDLFMSEENFKEYLGLLVSKKNIVLQGPPGVGKTFVAKRLAYSLLGSKDDTKVEMIQFHQSYAYEDFIQGYRPNPDSDGGFTLTTGIFYNICKRAENNPQSNYVLVIDEINRGNLSKIFGELLMLIETDKRGGEYQLSLTYAPAEKFSVPENMYLIGTMNTADRSIAMVDYALRRRFSFISLMPEFNKRFDNALKSAGFSKKLRKNIIDRVSVLNEEIRSDKNNLGDGYQIGHSYFCPDGSKPYNDDWYNRKIKYEIEPLLKEYWFDEQERVDGLLENLLIDS